MNILIIYIRCIYRATLYICTCHNLSTCIRLSAGHNATCAAAWQPVQQHSNQCSSMATSAAAWQPVQQHGNQWQCLLVPPPKHCSRSFPLQIIALGPFHCKSLFWSQQLSVPLQNNSFFQPLSVPLYSNSLIHSNLASDNCHLVPLSS